MMAQQNVLQNTTSFPFSSTYSWTVALLDTMPSMPSLTSYALSGLSIAQTALGLQNAVSRMPRALLAASETCNNPQLSCHNTTAVQNLCCFNAPGGSLLQTQFWDTNPASGPADSWTIHGLWVRSH